MHKRQPTPNEIAKNKQFMKTTKAQRARHPYHGKGRRLEWNGSGYTPKLRWVG